MTRRSDNDSPFDLPSPFQIRKPSPVQVRKPAGSGILPAQIRRISDYPLPFEASCDKTHHRPGKGCFLFPNVASPPFKPFVMLVITEATAMRE